MCPCLPPPGSRHRTYRRVAFRHHPGNGRLHPLQGREFPVISRQGEIESRHASIYNRGHANYKPQPAWQPTGALVRSEPAGHHPGGSRKLPVSAGATNDQDSTTADKVRAEFHATGSPEIGSVR